VAPTVDVVAHIWGGWWLGLGLVHWAVAGAVRRRIRDVVPAGVIVRVTVR